MLFQDLKAFVAVIECASLTKAAERLSLTQSAVSRRIQNLEAVLGTALFDRATRPPEPTAMGRRIYEQAVELLQDANALLAIPEQNAAPTGKFRVGFTQVISDVMAFDLVSGMRRTFPDLELQLITDWSSALEQRLRRGDLDAATLMQVAPGNPPIGLKAELVGTFDVLIVQSKAMPVSKASTNIGNLAAHFWILNPEGCGYRAALTDAMSATGNKLKLGVGTHGTTIQMRMIAAGMGLGLIPKYLFDNSPLMAELSVIQVDNFALKMEVWGAFANPLGNLSRAHDLLMQTAAQALSHSPL